MGVYYRGKIAWIRYADPTGEIQYESTGQRERRVAARIYAQRKREVADGTWRGRKRAAADRLRVRDYADTWFAVQRDRELASYRVEWQKFRDYVLPIIGDRVFTDLRPKDAIALVAELKRTRLQDGTLMAPRTVINAYAVFSRMCRDAVIEEILIATPCVLPRGTLPKKRDKDPTWRAQAIYTRDEVEMLISDERVPEDERVFYALMFLTGGRVGEASGRRWRDYDPTAKPLGRMSIATQYDDRPLKQSDRPREMPVLPALAAILAEWKLDGFPRWIGRPPRPDDFICPETSMQHKRRGEWRKSGSSWRRLDHTLKRLGLRHRRQHDARRTLTSLGRNAGADRDILRACTHGDRREVIDDYTTWSWEAKCREVAKIRVGRLGAGAVSVLERAGKT